MAAMPTICYTPPMRTTDATPEALDNALRDAVDAAVGQYGATVSSIRRDVDFDGDECLFVEIAYDRPGIPVDPSVIAALDGKLRNVAYDLGERAILYVRNRFPKGQRIITQRVITQRRAAHEMLPPNIVIAELDELTDDALLTRAAAHPAFLDLPPNPDRALLIDFLEGLFTVRVPRGVENNIDGGHENTADLAARMLADARTLDG